MKIQYNRLLFIKFLCGLGEGFGSAIISLLECAMERSL